MKLIFTLALLFCSTQVIAQSNFLVKAEILVGENLIGNPTIRIEDGVRGGITVEGVYNLTLTTSSTGENIVLVKANLEVGSEKYSPSMILQLNEKGQIKINNMRLILLVSKA